MDSMLFQNKSAGKEFYDDGVGFFRSALNSQKRFSDSPELISGYLLMAIEKFCMAICVSHGHMPASHVIGDLLETTNEFVTIDPEMIKKVGAVEKVDLCGFDSAADSMTYTADDVQTLISCAEMLKVCAEK